MKRKLGSVLFFFLISLAAFPAHSTSGNINFFLGQKSLDDSDYWDPVDDHTEYGILFDMIEKGWPISLELGFLASSDESTDNGVTYEAKTSEVSVGIKKIWTIRNFPLKPFISGGVAYISAEDSYDADFIQTQTEDDSAMGFYFSAGVYATLSQHLNLGLLFRISKAEVDLFEDNVGAGGEHFGLMIGYHF